MGISTSTFAYVTGNVGIGTLDLSNVFDNVHIREDSVCSVRITGDSAESYVAIGRSTDRLSQNAEIKYGNTYGAYPNSNPHTLDIINYSYGNINSYLHLGTLSGVGTGGFNWIYRTNNILMSLTYSGNLGLGVTNPTEKLKVVGVATITSNLYVNENITANSNITATNGNITATTGNITAGNNLTVSGITTLNGNTTIGGNLIVSGSFTSPINQTSGVSTFFNINVSNNLKVSGALGIGTDNPRATFDILEEDAIFGAIGVGTANWRAAVDFSSAGKNVDTTSSYMIPPKLTPSERVGLSTVEGGLIYNTISKSVESYNGTKWNNLTNPFTETTNLNNINAGIVTATDIRVGTGVTINGTAGIVTSINGFSSGIGTAVKITTVGNRLTFTVVGVGSTTLTLF